MCKNLLYKNAARKILVKLTPGGYLVKRYLRGKPKYNKLAKPKH